ncbi:uncharacterized protein C2845_PM05G37800 [Panicum miliaceum]|uniref:Uncharacterized protein n=1 Tax=Panicum miliaceum TaxID=4540 RepID=A0A3L6SZK3_PANMI|nr:uncharacterized protein C2845_PM05G37800 [Panicum miliaceum]
MSSGLNGLGNAMAASQSHHHDHGGNYGPVVGMLFFIAIVTAGSLALARYCVGSQAFQRTGYDLDAYVQRKFAVCVGAGLRPVKKQQACQPAAAAEEVTAAPEPPAEQEEEEEGAGDPQDTNQ